MTDHPPKPPALSSQRVTAAMPVFRNSPSAWLRFELQPARLLPTITATLIVWLIGVIVTISYGALIFSGDLSDHIDAGIGLALISATAALIFTALLSSYPGMIGFPQDTTAALMALMAANVTHEALEHTSHDAAYITVVAAIAITSIATGIVFYLIGHYRLGRFIQFVPFPVVGGFLAGTGWLLLRGGVGLMAGVSLSLDNLDQLVTGDILIRWLPGLLYAVVLLTLMRYRSHFLLLPVMLIVGVGLFYAALLITGTSVDEANARGLMLPSLEGRNLWQPLVPSDLRQVEWGVLPQQAGTLVSVLLVSVLHLLLNASGLELVLKRDL